VNARVDQDKHPNRRRHIANASPHAQHGTRVVISLQSGAALPLGENDGGIENLVELGEVEPPAPPRKAFIPHPSNVGRWGQAIGIKADEAVPVVPLVRLRVIRSGAAKSTRAIDFAESIDSADKCVGIGIMGEGPLQTVEHSIASDSGVDSKEDVVKNNECLEDSRLADGPRLVPMASVVRIQRDDCGRVDARNGQGDFIGQSSVEDICRNGEWGPDRGPIVGRRKRRRRRFRGKF
jgi:hypothetical protein